MSKNFNRGDIVRVSLNPTKGKEQQRDRPCLVLSPTKFNKLGVALVAPITQGGDYARFQGFTVSLTGTGMDTQGVVLINGVRMLDLKARLGTKIEQAPDYIVEDVIAKLSSLLEDGY